MSSRFGARLRKGAIPEEGEYRRHGRNRWVGLASLPVQDCPRVDHEHFGGLRLREAEFQSALLNVLADRPRVLVIRLRSGGDQPNVDQRQKGNAAMRLARVEWLKSMWELLRPSSFKPIVEAHATCSGAIIVALDTLEPPQTAEPRPRLPFRIENPWPFIIDTSTKGHLPTPLRETCPPFCIQEVVWIAV
jgi:hypothetical protein